MLREPLALRQCAIQRDPARLAIVRSMLGKRYRADAPTLVKANVPVNFLLRELAAGDASARAILLHLPWRDYLAAILRDEGHRTWLRNVTTQLAPWIGDLAALDDGARGAALWLAQTRAFADALARLPHARVLDAERFFADPAEVLKAAARHLALPLTDKALTAVASGPLFATYSKNPAVAFDNKARLARRAALERTLAPDLDRAAAWLADQPAAPTAVLDAEALIR